MAMSSVENALPPLCRQRRSSTFRFLKPVALPRKPSSPQHRLLFVPLTAVSESAEFVIPYESGSEIGIKGR